MPALLMHIQAARQLRREGSLPSPLREAVEQADWAYRLGSVLVDLPLFDRFWLKVSLFLVHQPYPESTWASAIHARGSARLAGALLRRAEGPRQEPLRALVAGLMTHLAFDRSMHPPIEEAVKEHLRPDETHDQLHEALENYQCLRWHREHLGLDGLGTAELREGVTVSPSRGARLPTWLAKILAEALGEVYEVIPEERLLQRWAAGMCGYRDLLSTKVAVVSVRSSERFAERRPWAAEVELDEAFSRALSLSKDYLNAAATERGETLAETIGDGPLV